MDPFVTKQHLLFETNRMNVPSLMRGHLLTLYMEQIGDARRNNCIRKGIKVLPSFVFMARCKFRSTAASLRKETSPNAVVDYGASHHFFHSRKSFRSYQEVSASDMESATVTASIFCFASVEIPLHGKTIIEAYHAPKFSTNILTVERLNYKFVISFSIDTANMTGKISYVFTLRNTKQDVLSLPDPDGLYLLAVKKPHTTIIISTDIETFLGGIFACTVAHKHYLQPRKLFTGMNFWGIPFHPVSFVLCNNWNMLPLYPSKAILEIFCHPCSVSKARRAPVSESSRLKIQPLELVHKDILGPMKFVARGENRYALGRIDSFTGKTDILFLSE